MVSSSGQNAKYLETVVQSGQLLLGIIDDILDVVKFNEDKVKLNKKFFDLNKTIQVVLQNTRIEASKKNLELIYTGSDNFPSVIGDSLRLQQVLLNLLGNAVKYTKKGTVTLMIDIRHKDAALHLRFSVTDTGVGISEEKHQKIFEDFSRFDNTQQGLGLGLAICKKLVKMMNGNIEIVSEEGKGSKFFFDIRLPIYEEAFVKNEILLVEDTESNVVVVKALLRTMGLDCDVVFDGNAALEITKKNKYKLILMDIRLPDTNGVETAKHIKKSNKDVVIVPITGEVFPETKVECIEAGMVGFLTKPLDLKKFKEVVEAYL